MRKELEKKIEQAIKLLRLMAESNDDVEVCYSGGKDSDVILELAKMAGVKFTAIYKATTIDPPHTIEHCREKGVQVVFPKRTFFQLLQRKGMSSRFGRWCCSELKEYKIKDTQILGIRKQESKKRAKLYKEPVVCRLYKKGEHVQQILPILDWNNQDLEEFIEERKIKLHPLYYRADGSIDIERRLGCLCCPLKSDNGLNDFKNYPKMVVTYIHCLKKWWNKPRKKPTSIKEKYSDVYEYFVCRVFYLSVKYMTLNKESLFPQDWKANLEDYFKIKLP